ncbi:MAG: MoxR family ATPase [Geminicoccaceae bacterium]|nr:MoxR family ATPase [Geminicoccaceae bacterium]
MASDHDIEAAIGLLGQVRSEIGRVIFGQDRVVDETLTAILSGGHALLIGLPGLAKTRLAETLGAVLGLDQGRVQFTPDLMPSDILGSEVLEEGTGGRQAFRFVKGPIFTRILLADEINRASPRTQSALLQAMQEHRVTVAGQTYDLPLPFHVIATQNPIEHEGTYPLPEAQLDRFLLQIDIGYPDLDAERRMLFATTTDRADRVRPVLGREQVAGLQELVRRMPIGEGLVDALLKLVREGRPGTSTLPAVREHVAWGPGPRASQALMLAVRARALLHGRLAPSAEDLAALAPAVLRHRMAVSFRARTEGVTVEHVIEALVRHAC